MSDKDPLAATLLYRELVQATLDKATTKYYKYAAKDLVECDTLAERIEDWESFQTHEDYIDTLREENKRKVRFWEECESAKRKQLLKEAKEKKRRLKLN